MASPEFKLIETYFKNLTQKDDSVLVGIGDDAAVIEYQPGHNIVVCVDTLVAGIHFPLEAPVDSIGYKSLAVNISDMAAMGATPKWATLALTLPENDNNWLKEFSSGFAEIAGQYGISLIGGDTTKGPLTISVQLMGVVEKGKEVTRSGAEIGDLICVTGNLGDASVGLSVFQNKIQLSNKEKEYYVNRLNCPTPRLNFSRKCTEFIKSAIDISDGLGADLNHILESSSNGNKLGAKIIVEDIPANDYLLSLPLEERLKHQAFFGDDYELCFTADKKNLKQIMACAEETKTKVTVIGEIADVPGIVFQDKLSDFIDTKLKGYDHFYV